MSCTVNVTETPSARSDESNTTVGSVKAGTPINPGQGLIRLALIQYKVLLY